MEKFYLPLLGYHRKTIVFIMNLINLNKIELAYFYIDVVLVKHSIQYDHDSTYVNLLIAEKSYEILYKRNIPI